MSNYNNNYGVPYPSSYPQLRQYAFVNGIEGAKAYQVMPNQTMLLMDSDKPVVFMKTADAIGKSTLRYFNLIEMDEVEAIKQYQPQPTPEYVSKSDFDALNARLDSLLKMIEKPNKTKIKEE